MSNFKSRISNPTLAPSLASIYSTSSPAPIANDYYDKPDDLSAEQVEEEIANIQIADSKLAQQNSSFSLLLHSVNSSKSDLESVKRDVSNIKNEVSNIKNEMSSLRQNVANLMQSINSINKLLISQSEPPVFIDLEVNGTNWGRIVIQLV
jgi:septal ring factor EnvC (AmiA/AmiB activator)